MGKDTIDREVCQENPEKDDSKETDCLIQFQSSFFPLFTGECRSNPLITYFSIWMKKDNNICI